MIRVLLAIVVAALAVAVILVPRPSAPAFEDPVAVDTPPVAVCPIEEGSGRSTTLGVVSGSNGDGRFTVFAGGDSVGAMDFNTGASGSAAMRVADVAAVGTAAGLIELPGAVSSGGALLTGEQSIALDTCLTTPAPQTVLAGGSTLSDQQFQLQLMNPYAGEAVVDLVIQSESGLETASQLRAIAVPSRSSFVVDLSEVLPGRESLSITIDVTDGSVMATGRFAVGNEVALWHSVEPALDWFVPVPAGGLGGQLLISSAIGAEVEYQLDVYGPDGLVEAFQSGVVPERGISTVSLSEFGFETASAFRVISTQPVGVFLRGVSGSAVALTSGSSSTGSRWLLPAAGVAPGTGGAMTVLNAGLEETSVVVTAHREESAAERYPVPGGSVLEIPAIEGGANAYTVRADGAVVPLWATTTETGLAYSSGVAFDE